MDRKKQIKFMTYNVWSREDVVLYTRMQAIGRLVNYHSPDVIFFQEITPYTLQIFKTSAWLKRYYYYSPDSLDLHGDKKFCMIFSKLPLSCYERNSMLGSGPDRRYLEGHIEPAEMKPIYIATTQLECPIPPTSMHFIERYRQAEDVLAKLSRHKNVVFGGDMSWDDKADLPFPLRQGWVDAACSLGERGWTYDAFWNEKVVEFNGCTSFESMKKPSDRFVCKLQDYKLDSIHLIGDEHLGVEYKKELKGLSFPLRPSCHRGLVLTIVPK